MGSGGKRGQELRKRYGLWRESAPCDVTKGALSLSLCLSPVSQQVHCPLGSGVGRGVDRGVGGVGGVAGSAPLILAGAEAADWLRVGIEAAELAVEAVGDAAGEVHHHVAVHLSRQPGEAARGGAKETDSQ